MAVRKDGWLERVPVAVVLSVQHDPRRKCSNRVNLDLYLDIGRNPYVEDLAVAGKPSVSPPAVVAYADGSDGVDNSKWDGPSHRAHHARPLASGSERIARRTLRSTVGHDRRSWIA